MSGSTPGPCGDWNYCVSAGNAGFETGNHIVGNAAYIHMTARYTELTEKLFANFHIMYVRVLYSTCLVGQEYVNFSN